MIGSFINNVNSIIYFVYTLHVQDHILRILACVGRVNVSKANKGKGWWIVYMVYTDICTEVVLSREYKVSHYTSPSRHHLACTALYCTFSTMHNTLLLTTIDGKIEGVQKYYRMWSWGGTEQSSVVVQLALCNVSSVCDLSMRSYRVSVLCRGKVRGHTSQQTRGVEPVLF